MRSATIPFIEGQRVQGFVLALSDAFPLIRMFLDDEDDALIAMFLQTKRATVDDLKQMRGALGFALGRMSKRYPGMMPPNPTLEKRYSLERCMVTVVANLANATLHLQSTVSSFVSVLESGGDITTL